MTDEPCIILDIEPIRCFVLGEDGVTRQVSGPPAPPSPPPRKWQPCCEAPARIVTCMAFHFGPDRNLWACANCKRTGYVYEIDGTPREEWPPEPGPAREPDAVYETSRGRIAVYRQPLVD